MNYRIYNKIKILKYEGCQCFKDCDCYNDYPKEISEAFIDVYYNNITLTKAFYLRHITNGGIKSFVDGMIQSYEAKLKRENP